MFYRGACCRDRGHNPAQPASPEVEDFYLKGRYYWSKRTPDDLNKAVDFFTQAIVHDPGYAPAYVGLADCYNLLREFSAMPPSEAFPRALAAAQKAIPVDPRSSEAHLSFGVCEFLGIRAGGGRGASIQTRNEFDPKNARAHHWYATFLTEIRRSSRGLGGD